MPAIDGGCHAMTGWTPSTAVEIRLPPAAPLPIAPDSLSLVPPDSPGTPGSATARSSRESRPEPDSHIQGPRRPHSVPFSFHHHQQQHGSRLAQVLGAGKASCTQTVTRGPGCRGSSRTLCCPQLAASIDCCIDTRLPWFSACRPSRNGTWGRTGSLWPRPTPGAAPQGAECNQRRGHCSWAACCKLSPTAGMRHLMPPPRAPCCCPACPQK